MAKVINTDLNVCKVSFIKEKGFSGTNKELYNLSKLYDNLSTTAETFTFIEDKSESVTADVFCEQPNFIADGIYYPLGSDLYGYKISEIKNVCSNRYKDKSTAVIKPPTIEDSNALLEGIPFTFEGVTPCNKYSCNLLQFPKDKTSWGSYWKYYNNGVKNDLTITEDCDNIYYSSDCLELYKVPKNTYFEYVVDLDASSYTVSCNMRVFNGTTSGSTVLMVLPNNVSYSEDGATLSSSIIGHVNMDGITDDWKRFYYSFTPSAKGSYKIIIATNSCNLNNANNYDNFNIKICGLMLTKTAYPMTYNALEQNYSAAEIQYKDESALVGTLGYPAIFDIFNKDGGISYNTGFTITYKRKFPYTNTNAYDYLGKDFRIRETIDSNSSYNGRGFVTEQVVFVVKSDFSYIKYSSLANSETYKDTQGSNLLLSDKTYLYLGYNPNDKTYSNNTTYSDLIVYNEALTDEKVKKVFNTNLTFSKCYLESIKDYGVLLKHTNFREMENL